MDNRLVVSTYQRLMLLQDGQQYTLDEGNGPYFGLTWNRWYLFVGVRRWATAETEAIQIYNRRLQLVETYELPGINQLHQIYWRRGLLYLTNTQRDRVMETDLHGSMSTVYHAEFETALREGDADRRHINGLWCDSDLFYISELHGAIKVFTPFWRLMNVFDLPYELHNVYLEGAHLYTCASDSEAVLRLNLSTDETDLFNVGGHLGVMQDANDLHQAYTRGLARTYDRWYIGASAIQNEREDRVRGDSAILAFDNNWQFVESIRLPDTGQLVDVRVLGCDRAHGGTIWR